MALWTDIVDPATLTGYARESLAEYEAKKGTLAVYLPNRFADDIVARFVVGSNGLLDAAEYRAYDAETPIGSLPGGQRKTIELPPLGLKVRVSEYDQLRSRGNATDEAALATVTKATDRVVRSVSDRIEAARGAVLSTGIAAINENGFTASADYGRSAAFNATAATLWSDPASKPLEDLQVWRDLYVDENGEQPGSLLLPNKVLTALSAHPEFRGLAATVGGTPSVVTRQHVEQVLSAFGLPPIVTYDRRARRAGVNAPILPANKVFLLPAPVEPNDSEGTDLGGTVWGTTLEASEPNYGLAVGEEPGIVAGTYKDDDPLGVWVKAAAIGLPVLANANLSLAATVLA